MRAALVRQRDALTRRVDASPWSPLWYGAPVGALVGFVTYSLLVEVARPPQLSQLDAYRDTSWRLVPAVVVCLVWAVCSSIGVAYWRAYRRAATAGTSPPVWVDGVYGACFGLQASLTANSVSFNTEPYAIVIWAITSIVVMVLMGGLLMLPPMRRATMRAAIKRIERRDAARMVGTR
jgi:hypothetical protein